jgi:FkbM family methyltransferase
MKTFVEIGSSYFNTLRHLCDKGWKGIMIDPLEIALNKIPDHDNLIKVIGAIDKENTIKKLTKIKDEYWDQEEHKDFFGMASLNLKHPIHKIYYPEMIESIDVACISFDTLMEILQIQKIDYLKIDTEGLDYDILSSIDFNKFNIKAIRAEHKHVSLSLLVDLLEKNNYLVDVFEDDIIAIK